MKWIKEGKVWVAVGKLGRFTIKYFYKMWHARYCGDNYKVFNLPPSKSIKTVKKMCEENHYWEEE